MVKNNAVKYVLALFGAGLVSLSAQALVSPAAHADTAPGSGLPATVSTDALPTAQVDGVVWAQVTVGNTVYATGSFTRSWPAGSSNSSAHDTPRANLLAYDITTGKLITSFAHSLNAQGLAITASPNGKYVYVGGDFTKVDGQSRGHFAVFDTANGALDPAIDPNLNGQVRAITASSSTIYVGGGFSAADNKTRTRLAAFAASTGAVQAWAPSADDASVMSMVLAPDGSRVIVGGHFSTLNGVVANGLGAVSTSTGATLPFPANKTIKDYGESSAITSLTADAKQVYASGYSYIAQDAPVEGNLEGTAAINPDTGEINWVDDCHGDTYGTMPVGPVLYSVSHAHDCSAIGQFPDTTDPRIYHHALAETTTPEGGRDNGPDAYGWNYRGIPDTTLLQWFPTLSIGTYTQQDQAAWSISGNAKYISLGGEFPAVNGVAAHGLTRFAVSSLAPNKMGPVAASSALTPSLTAATSSSVKISWQTTWDTDNRTLTYRVYRDGAKAPIYSTTADSTFWALPALTYTDTSVTPGSSHSYQVRATDPFGNSTSGKTASVTLPRGGGGGGNATTATDSFGRTVADGWGTATSGTAWKSATAAALNVHPGAGTITLAKPKSDAAVWLDGFASTNTDTTATLSTDKVATGSGIYLYLIGRRVATSTDERALVRLLANGTVGISLLSDNAGTMKMLAGEQVVKGVNYQPGASLNVRLQVTGTSPTALRLKVWPAKSAEPSTWQLTTTDTTSALQVNGSVGFESYLSGSATKSPVTETVSAFASRPAQ